MRNRLPTVVASALKWPPFLFSIFVLYWSLNIFLLTYKVKWLNFRKKRNDVLAWASAMKDIYRFKVLRVGTRELYRNECMYLCNHRSWADFMVDQYVTEGRSLFMSRWAVAAVFPLFMLPMRVVRAVICFKRGKIGDLDRFNKWIDTQLAESPQSALAVYPEGHRSTHGESLPLKRGMVKYAFTRNMPVQIVIGGNKEAILSEKHCTARFNQTVSVGFSEVLIPKEYADFDAFMAKVQERWDAQWNAVFGAELDGLPELPHPEPQWDYPLDIKLYMVFFALAEILISVWAAKMTYSVGRFVFTLMGPLRWPVASILVAYVVFSFYTYSQPVSALVVHQRMMNQMRRPSRVIDTAGSITAESDGGSNHELKKID